jgi:hypothetical protein
MRSPCCLCVCVSIGVNQSLWNLVCITLRWAHINGILRKYVWSDCPSVCSLIVASQRLYINITAATNTYVTIELCSPCRIKESRRLVLPITSCCYWCSTLFTKRMVGHTCRGLRITSRHNDVDLSETKYFITDWNRWRGPPIITLLTSKLKNVYWTFPLSPYFAPTEMREVKGTDTTTHGVCCSHTGRSISPSLHHPTSRYVAALRAVHKFRCAGNFTNCFAYTFRYRPCRNVKVALLQTRHHSYWYINLSFSHIIIRYIK